MTLSKRLRFEIFKRDLFVCQYCGKRPPDVVLEVDHINPKCEGGTDIIANLTTACFDCNRGKAGNSLTNTAPALNELEVLAAIQEMAERRASLKQQVVATEALREAEDDAISSVCGWWCEAFGPDDGYFELSSVRRFVKLMDLADITKAIDITATFVSDRHWISDSNRWWYFCGTCWKIIKGAGVA
jgi:hypothetical protein